MCQGPEAGPHSACLRNSERPEWVEGRVGEMRLAWAPGAGGVGLNSSGARSPQGVFRSGVAWSHR